MPTPIGWDTREPLCGENDPLGREDTANKYAKTLWANIQTGHNPDGTHKVGGLGMFETGVYTGNGMAGRVITMRNPNMVIRFLRVTASAPVYAATYSDFYPLSSSGSMTAGDAKRVETAAFVTGAVSALGTGQFTISAAAGINYQNLRYVWEAYGNGTIGTPRVLAVAVKTADNSVQNDVQSNGPTLAGIVAQYGGATGDYQLLPIASNALNSRNITYNGSAFTIVAPVTWRQVYLVSEYQTFYVGTDSTFVVKAGWLKGNDRLTADASYDIRIWTAAAARNYRLAVFKHNSTGVMAISHGTSASGGGQPAVTLTNYTYQFDIINSYYQYNSGATPPWYASFQENRGYW